VAAVEPVGDSVSCSRTRRQGGGFAEMREVTEMVLVTSCNSPGNITDILIENGRKKIEKERFNYIHQFF